MSRYVRILGAFYLRLTGTDIDVYRYLEPLYNDYRKLRRKLGDGRKYLFQNQLTLIFSYIWYIVLSFFDVLEFSLTHVDEVIDELLTKDYSCDIALPRIKKRYNKQITFSFFSRSCL